MKKWIVCVLIAGAIGCGDDTQPTADAAAPDAPIVTPDAPMADAAPCTTLLPPTTTVVQTQLAQTAPVPVGGMFPAGTYVLTADVIYTGPGGPTGDTGVTHQSVTRNNGSTGTMYEYASIDNMNVFATTPNITSGSYTLHDGGGITVTQTCPNQQPLNFTSYDVTANSLTVYSPAGIGRTEALTFTLQP